MMLQKLTPFLLMAQALQELDLLARLCSSARLSIKVPNKISLLVG